MVNRAPMTLTFENKSALAKAAQVNLLITDNDGVLTDGCVYYSAHGEELKKYSLRDGMGVQRLREEVGIETFIMTRENSPIVQARANKLKLKGVFLGIWEKGEALGKYMHENNLSSQDIAYIGDDVNDLPAMELCGFTACPQDAIIEVKEVVDYVSPYRGGAGVFRDVAELILNAHKLKGQGEGL